MITKQHFVKQYCQIPASLLQPLWLRSRESLRDNGLIYDPIAARACQRCHLAPECLAGDINQKQLLYVTLTQLCDQQISQFIKRNPDGWIINVAAGLDTRFYRLDNGRCHWIELDVTENLLWRQKLFHRSERYHQICGSVNDLSWLESLSVIDKAPVMVVCEHALLDCTHTEIADFIQSVGIHFESAETCLIVAGDLTACQLGQKMGSGHYAHGYRNPAQAMLNYLPWAHEVKVYSPLQQHCARWKLWQRWLNKYNPLKQRLTPVLVQLRW